MSKTLQTDWSTRPVAREGDVFKNNLANLRVLDIGYIEQILAGGTNAVITLCDGSQKLIAELISVGSDSAPLLSATAGQYVLVLFPRTAVSLKDGTVADVNVYDFRYAKALPIGVSGKNTVQLSSSINCISVNGKTYTVECSEDLVQFIASGLNVSLHGTNGTLSIGNENTSINLMQNGNVEVVTGATYDQQTGEVTQEGVSVLVSSDGVTVKVADGKTIVFDGDVEITKSLKVANTNLTVDA